MQEGPTLQSMLGHLPQDRSTLTFALAMPSDVTVAKTSTLGLLLIVWAIP